MQSTKERAAATYDLIDLAQVNLPLLDEPQPAASGKYIHEHTKRWSAQIAACDGFVFITPEYNRGIPASLKNALDFLYGEWTNKAAGLVVYGSSGGLRAGEQLKSILGELQIATVRAQVSLSIYDDVRDFAAMALRDFQRANATKMLEQLENWAAALATTRSPE